MKVKGGVGIFRIYRLLIRAEMLTASGNPAYALIGEGMQDESIQKWRTDYGN